MKQYILAHDTARQRAVEGVRQAPTGHVVRICEPRKSRDQECMYHAMISDFAEQYDFHGKRLDAETMKRLLIEQFRYETAQEFADMWRDVGSFDMAPSMDGARVVMLGPQSRRFPKKLAMAFIDWLHAKAVECGINL